MIFHLRMRFRDGRWLHRDVEWPMLHVPAGAHVEVTPGNHSEVCQVQVVLDGTQTLELATWWDAPPAGWTFEMGEPAIPTYTDAERETLRRLPATCAEVEELEKAVLEHLALLIMRPTLDVCELRILRAHFEAAFAAGKSARSRLRFHWATHVHELLRNTPKGEPE